MGGESKDDKWTNIYADNLPERDKLVYLYLKERCGKANECFPSMKTIAKNLCVRKKTVKRAVHELEKNGYINTEQRWRENEGKNTLLFRIMK